MKAPEHLPPEKLPDPWLYDTKILLKDLDYIQELILRIPPTFNEQHGPINTAADAVYHLKQNLLYLVGLHEQRQAAWRAAPNAQTNKPRQTQRPARQVGARTSYARRSA
jgi:hypothetical protein